jgi:hypothetical protein
MNFVVREITYQEVCFPLHTTHIDRKILNSTQATDIVLISPAHPFRVRYSGLQSNILSRVLTFVYLPQSWDRTEPNPLPHFQTHVPRQEEKFVFRRYEPVQKGAMARRQSGGDQSVG